MAWNDAALVCGVGAMVCLILMIVAPKIEARKAHRRGEWKSKL